MARFKFHLEPVLRQRQAKEEAAEQALYMAHSEHNMRLAVLENTKNRLEQSLAAHERVGIDVFEEMQLSFYRESLSEKIITQAEDVGKAAVAVEERRKKAVQARQDRQVIEKLKDKHLDNYRRAEEAREQKLVDEMALYSHFRAGK
ncbi:flagellar export protein FliJ [Pelotomaculum propionicicum]|uniref:flagellar export protein FliJ n=1 Tax=Pelotomaculum propionicicum TaxID=258475 RepID=UPI003B7C1F13